MYVCFMQNSKSVDNNVAKTINNYSELIETVSRVEHARFKSLSNLIEHAELVNIATMAVHIVLSFYMKGLNLIIHIYQQLLNGL